MAFRAGLRPLTATAGASDTFGLGCAPIGNLYHPVAESDAEETVAAALARGIRFFDTAPHYGAGASEARLGRTLAGVDRDTVAIATKVGRRIVDADGAAVPTGRIGVDTVGDLTRDGVLRSVEGSLERLGTDRIDLLHLHDPLDVDEALAHAMPALVDLRAQGIVRAIGVGMVWPEPLTRFVREADVDVVMIAGRTTLLDHRGETELLPEAALRGVGVIAAGVFNSGILADPVGAPFFDYREATPGLRNRARRLAAVCDARGVPLRHVAARYPQRLPAVEAVVVGARTAAEVDDFADAESAVIPDDLWAELEDAAEALEVGRG
ncbi:aldo/keto reductase [Microbacterium sp. QXD-8]|uniref:Aldo/keto reductase n=1 Tax=Microbacterium psychrotolerans TaxID=3068321 RepID=A0ABU0YXB1_9MICO|nr:aldo/keto reductase [Microbacterium sp. QXD-8]MDQ7876962.1 aldo/keto reductase [Microbacterium sp. QXD-8]